MQLKLTLKGDNIKLPIATAHTLQGFIYSALGKDTEYQKTLHERGNIFDERKFKLFTFGELRGKYTIVEKNIIYPQSASLEIRCADSYMIQILHDYFLQNKNLTLGGNSVSVSDISLLDKNIFSDNMKVKTLSPVTVYITEEDGYTRYFSPEEDLFYDSIVKNAQRKWGSFSKDIKDFSFSIEPLPDARFVKRATRFKKTLITAWHGEFYLKGSPEVLNFLYHTGLGSKNSQGFGMFEII